MAAGALSTMHGEAEASLKSGACAADGAALVARKRQQCGYLKALMTASSLTLSDLSCAWMAGTARCTPSNW